MSDGLALLKTILLFPDEDTPRLLYADWLQENGRERRAEFIRVQVEMAQIRDESDPKKGLFAEGGELKYKDPPALARYRELDARQRELVRAHGREWFPFGVFAREELSGSELPINPFGECRRGFFESVTCSGQDFFRFADDLLWDPGQAEDCEECGGRVTGCGHCSGGKVPRPVPPAAQPVRKVDFTTWPHWSFNEYGCGFVGRRVKDHLYGGDHDRRSIATRLFKKEWPWVECEFPRAVTLLNGSLVSFEVPDQTPPAELLRPGTPVVISGNTVRVAGPGERPDGHVAGASADLASVSLLVNRAD